jgi:hypothetical protein
MFFFVCLMTLSASALIPLQPAPSETERENDTYRIYSLLMSNPRTSHGPDNNPRYLIAETTSLGIPEPPCVRPPKEREEEFKEVIADFTNRKATPRILKRRLSISKPYELLTGAQVNTFKNCHGGFPKRTCETPHALFDGVDDLFTLSDVYFSKSGRLALTAVSTWCGDLCAQYEWKVLEKLPDGEWKERPWVVCFSISEQSQRVLARAAP